MDSFCHSVQNFYKNDDVGLIFRADEPLFNYSFDRGSNIVEKYAIAIDYL